MIQTAVGNVTVTRIEEMLTPGFDPAFLFPDFDAAILADHPQLTDPRFYDAATGRLMSSMQSWLLRQGVEIILVDTGCGNGKTRSAAAFQRFHQLDLPYLELLAAVGVRREDVTMVINTHLHVDHVGWNTMRFNGRWVPTFPNARYVWGRVEANHWLFSPDGLRCQPEAAEVIEDSIRPVYDAGRVDLVDDGDEVLPGLSLHAAPGHTIGQMQVRLASAGAVGIFTADCLHQPMQVYRPEWSTRFCESASGAVKTRELLLSAAADDGAVLFPSHFGAPHAGTIVRRAGGYRFVPLGEAA